MNALLFPGQGAEASGFLHRLSDHPLVARTLDEASEVLGTDVRAFDEPDTLRSTAIVQPALVIAGVATARALACEGVRPDIVAGLSIGAFTAAVACGSLAFADALLLARLRGELMHATFPIGYGLMAIGGLDERQVERIARQVSTTECPAFIANVDAPRQIVVGGSNGALEAVDTLAREEGAPSVHRLSVSVPSHGWIMQPIADRLVREMAGLTMRVPVVPYIDNREGRARYDADAIREDLATNVAHTVRWSDALEVARELGTTLFIELPPGEVSTHLAKRAFPDIGAVAVADRGLHHAVVTSRRAAHG